MQNPWCLARASELESAFHKLSVGFVCPGLYYFFMASSVLSKPSTQFTKLSTSSLKYPPSILLASPFSTISLYYSICEYRTFISLLTDSIIPSILLQPPNLFLEILTVTSAFLPRSIKHTSFNSIIPLLLIITS